MARSKTQNQPAAAPAEIDMIPLTKLVISPKMCARHQRPMQRMQNSSPASAHQF